MIEWPKSKVHDFWPWPSWCGLRSMKLVSLHHLLTTHNPMLPLLYRAEGADVGSMGGVSGPLF